jgi:hypothetical protein
MFDIKTVPKIVIREGISGNTEIKKDGKTYNLFIDGLRWMMVDTKSSREVREFYSSYDLASGSVLLSGFGFGILPQWLSSKDSVTDITVVEYSKDVVDLFLRHNTLNSKIDIKIMDINTYQDGHCYDWVILDHYELDRVPTKENLSVIEENINFNNLWFWSLEEKLQDYTNWEEFRNSYSLKLPKLDNSKLNEYFKLLRYKEFLRDQ